MLQSRGKVSAQKQKKKRRSAAHLVLPHIWENPREKMQFKYAAVVEN